MASIGNKRDYEVSEAGEGRDVCVHGVPVQVSPVKESRTRQGMKYFDAKLGDGKKFRRLVSFDANLHPALKKAEEEKSVVALVNSTVKKNSVTEQVEVHLNKYSQVISSPRKIDIGEAVVSSSTAKIVKIADIVDIALGQTVEVTCKVWKVGEVQTVKKKANEQELRKQDVFIGDETMSCRLVVWECDVSSLEEGKTYVLSNVKVKKWKTEKFLSFTADSGRQVAENVVDVNEALIGADEEEDCGRSTEGEIVVVISTAEYLSCKICCAKALPDESDLAQCSKCQAVMKVSTCAKMKSARFVVKEDGGRETTLSAFEPILSQIVDGVSGSSIACKLMMCGNKKFKYNERNVIFSVSSK